MKRLEHKNILPTLTTTITTLTWFIMPLPHCISLPISCPLYILVVDKASTSKLTFYADMKTNVSII